MRMKSWSSIPFDEVIQASTPPTQEEENGVIHFPFQVFDDAMFYDSEGQEIEESLDVLNPSCYNETNELINNIDEFIHVGDVNGMLFAMMEIQFTTLNIISNCFLHHYHM
jgi:hypothetical protein